MSLIEPTQDSGSIEKLIHSLQLSPQSLLEIRELMQNTHKGFIEAAIALNVISQEQADAFGKLNLRSVEGISIMEAARRKASHRRVVGTPLRPEGHCKPGPKLTIAHDAYGERSEKYRGLRTELTLRLGNLREAAAITIASPGHQEGRTQLAADLAVAFSQLERRTLLVDADLRSPSIHTLFGCPMQPGLAEALSDESDPYLYGVEGLGDLHLLCAGAIPPNPLELLSTKRFEHLLRAWRQQYDIIIFDTPPVTNFADALTVSTLAKRTLITSRANHTRVDDSKEMLRRLAITNTEILGAVMHRF